MNWNISVGQWLRSFLLPIQYIRRGRILLFPIRIAEKKDFEIYAYIFVY